MQNNFDSLPSIDMAGLSQYDFESFNNDGKVQDMLNTVFPEFNYQDLPILVKVQRGINILRNTVGLGQVIVHVRPVGEKSSVEFRGSFRDPEKE